MNAAHLHLLVNHFPVVGSVFGVAFFLIALFKRNELLIKSSLWILLAVAAAAALAYATGDPAKDFIAGLPGVDSTTITAHEEMAEKAFIAAMVMGLFAYVGLLAYRKKKPLRKWYLPVLLAVSIGVVLLMGLTANLGGQIRHPEILVKNVQEIAP